MLPFVWPITNVYIIWNSISQRLIVVCPASTCVERLDKILDPSVTCQHCGKRRNHSVLAIVNKFQPSSLRFSHYHPRTNLRNNFDLAGVWTHNIYIDRRLLYQLSCRASYRLMPLQDIYLLKVNYQVNTKCCNIKSIAT